MLVIVSRCLGISFGRHWTNCHPATFYRSSNRSWYTLVYNERFCTLPMQASQIPLLRPEGHHQQRNISFRALRSLKQWSWPLCMWCPSLHGSSMLTIDLSAAMIIDEYCAVSVLGMSHCKILIDENRHIKIVHNYLALVIHDYLLTFGGEVKFFWKPRQLNGAMILFLLNRYLTLVVQILLWVPFPPSFQVRCFASRWLRIRS